MVITFVIRKVTNHLAGFILLNFSHYTSLLISDGSQARSWLQTVEFVACAECSASKRVLHLFSIIGVQNDWGFGITG